MEPPTVHDGHVGVEGTPGGKEVKVQKLCIEDTLFQGRERDCSRKHTVREDQHILIVIFALVIVWAAGEVISFIVFSGFVDEFVGVLH